VDRRKSKERVILKCGARESEFMHELKLVCGKREEKDTQREREGGRGGEEGGKRIMWSLLPHCCWTYKRGFGCSSSQSTSITGSVNSHLKQNLNGVQGTDWELRKVTQKFFGLSSCVFLSS
jgi:hypothetical protein